MGQEIVYIKLVVMIKSLACSFKARLCPTPLCLFIPYLAACKHIITREILFGPIVITIDPTIVGFSLSE